MRLHVKLALILTGSMVVLLSGAQFWQVNQEIERLQRQSDEAIARLLDYERANATNVARAAKFAVAGSLERGEMEKFARALDAQRSIEGLVEFSLFSQGGKIVNSTDPSRLGAPFPDEHFERSTFETQMSERPDRLELLSVEPIEPDCRRCHLDWPESGFGGALYMAFSRDAVLAAKEDATESMAAARAEAIRSGSILVVALCVVLALLVHVFLGRPLSRFIGMLDHFRDTPEDLTYRIPVTRRDEIGRLAETLNAFLEQVHRIVERAATGAARVREHSSEIATINEAMAEKIEQQRSRTTQIAVSTEEMAATSREVASQASALQQTSTDAGDRAREGGEVVSQAVESMRDLAATVSGASSLVDELDEHSRGISGVVELIDSIAGQTNLLALNATIEAARAGEHGRGFAVVAEEVRALAQRTQEATENISRSIAQMNDVTQRSVTEMGKGAHVADDVLALAERAGTALTEINAGVASVTEAIGSISTAAEQQSAATSEIATTVDAIDGATREHNEGAQTSAATSRSLLDDAAALEEEIQRFRI